MEQYRVTLDSGDENTFLIHISAGHKINVIRGPSSCLYYFDAGNIHMSKLKLVLSFLNTVYEVKNIFKNQEVQKATDTVMLKRKNNHIAMYKFVQIIQYNCIQNNPITVRFVRRSQKFMDPCYQQ